MSDDSDDDALALGRAIERGLNQTELTKVDFIVDVLDRSQQDTVISRLRDRGYECDAWDDPVDKSLSIYAGRVLYPTLDAILAEKEEIKRILAGLSVAVDDWGTAISP